jgi:hypothetical protein
VEVSPFKKLDIQSWRFYAFTEVVWKICEEIVVLTAHGPMTSDIAEVRAQYS